MSDAWWARKLGGQPAPQPQQQRAPGPQYPQQPQQPAPQQYQQPVQQPQQPAYEMPGDNIEVPIGELLATKTYDRVPDKATAQRQSSGQCPSCGSGNYLVTGTAGRHHEHCHDCGYPVVQAGSGMGALGGTGIIASGGSHQAQSPTYSQRLS